MVKLFVEHKEEIRNYCAENGLDFSKLEKSPKSFNNDLIAFQHVDPEKGKRGLLDETPAAVTLWVRKIEGNLVFEQTQHTRRYLAQ